MSKIPDATTLVARRSDSRSGKVFVPAQARRPVIGLEAEFTIYVDGEKRLPEEVFGNPQQIIRAPMIPRVGRSFHLPSGGAIYFDTGVVEVATPIIELESGCCIRAVRSLWEQIRFLRAELDHWEERTGSHIRLEGFSTHYNISVPETLGANSASMRRLALLLTYLLAAPIALLAANRCSTGVGVRPREKRLEVTVDFTPDPELMLAAVTFAIGVIAAVCAWPSFHLAELVDRGFPLIRGFTPRKHTSRKGFLARSDCFPQNPFATDPNLPLWSLVDGRTVTLRQIAAESAKPFRDSLQTYADPAVIRHIFAIFDGRARSLLDFAHRPGAYEDVGRIIDWERREYRAVPRSKYEQVIHRILTHEPIRVGPHFYAAERMSGWYEVVFRNTVNGRRRVFNLDDLVRHCAI